MTEMSIQTNAPYPNRIQWILGDSYTGPLTQIGPLGAFDPRRDLRVYVDGTLVSVRSFVFDLPNNRYLLYMSQNINLQGVVQVIHHMPNPPFYATQSISPITTVYLPGFALMGVYSTLGDGALAPMAFADAIPSTMVAYTPIYVVWNTVNIVQVEITGNNGVDPPVNSGLISVVGTEGLYEIVNGLQQSMTLTFNAYDTLTHIAVTILLPLTVIFTPIVITDGFGQNFAQEFSS